MQLTALALVCGTVLGTGPVRADQPPRARMIEPAPGPALGLLRIDRDLLAALADGGAFVLEGVPVGGGQPVNAVVERFRVSDASTRYAAIGDEGEHEHGFDPERMILLRGHVEGAAGSAVYLAVAEGWGIGRIDTGAGGPAMDVRLLGRHGEDPWAAAAARGTLTTARGAGVPLCGLGDHGLAIDPTAPAQPPGEPDGPQPIRGLKQVEISIDADFEFYELFNDPQQAMEYLTALYGAVSDLYIRDCRARLDIVQVRLFTTPNDPYGQSVGMPNPPRPPNWDQAQLISGRRDATAGGVGEICGNQSWVAYAHGFFVDAFTTNIFNQDVEITAHEFGHCVGSQHTDVYMIDRCNNPTQPPRRGTIMSYCTQTYSGTLSLLDTYFHTRVRQAIAACINPRTNTYVNDCNQNRISDALDISQGRSRDVNGNNIPDECEDCNGNQRLDSLDISTGFSRDVNGNGIPDECEPDCNNNQIPDSKDIADQTSTDAYGNGIPDECEVDCNNNGVSDYTEIMLNMALDKDRNAQLDSCQDCDDDRISDLEELGGAHNLWAADRGDGLLKEYHGIVGVLQRTNTTPVTASQDLLITRDRRILVTSADTDRVAEFDARGAYVRDLVTPGAGGLDYPTGMAIIAGGAELLVSSRDTDSVLRFDASSGAFLGQFVPPGLGGLDAPYFITVGPGGGVYVGSNGGHSVLEYDGSGAFVRTFVAPGAGGLSRPRGLLFLDNPDRFIVASHGTDQLLQYDGATGAFQQQFHNGDYLGKLNFPWDIARGRDGDVYVSRMNISDVHQTDPRVFEFDDRNGYLIRAYVQAIDSQLVNPAGIDFMPGDGYDCNFNMLPDSCDITSGRSLDANNNGIPDECEPCYADCDTSTGVEVLDVFDFLCFQNRYAANDPYACDCDVSSGPGTCDIFDFLCFQNAYAAGCP